MLILIIGDFYIPSRASDLPKQFKKLLVPGKISTILCTGNVDKQTLEYLSTICNQVYHVRGHQDPLKTKEMQVLEFNGLTFGLVNPVLQDPLKLEQCARQLNVNVLISGGTHQLEAYEKNSRFYINPGSCTGAFTMDKENIVPSFVLMDLGNYAFSLYIYKIVRDQIKVEKMDYQFTSIR